MTEDPRLGVVIAAWRASTSIGSTLASLAGQSLRAGAVVVVDDGSDDGTAQAAERFSSVLPLRVIRHDTNRGVVAALRTGMAAVDAPIITWLGADDYAFPDHLETLFGLQLAKGGITSADVFTWLPGKATARRSWYERHPSPPRHKQLAELARYNWVLGTTMMRKDLLEAVGGLRDWLACEDWELWLRVAEAGHEIFASTHPTVLYRQVAGGMSKGERFATNASSMMTAFAGTTTDLRVARIARSTSRRLRHQAKLYKALAAAREGHLGEARSHAVHVIGLVPDRVHLFRGVAALAAPVSAARLYDRLQNNPTHIVGP